MLGHEFAALAGLLACKVVLCRPRDPESRPRNIGDTWAAMTSPDAIATAVAVP